MLVTHYVCIILTLVRQAAGRHDSNAGVKTSESVSNERGSNTQRKFIGDVIQTSKGLGNLA